jgi:diadenosine tetraphosphatase ApaH/serine/threonine PP2A family protein phosphatase
MSVDGEAERYVVKAASGISAKLQADIPITIRLSRYAVVGGAGHTHRSRWSPEVVELAAEARTGVDS